MKKIILIIPILLITCFANAQTSPIKNIVGRIAYSADGDDHDTDDWLASPWSIALLRASGQDTKVVHFEYNNHVWGTKGNFDAIQRGNITGAVSRWGGFTNTKFFDIETQEITARNNLVAEINKSSATDPLWIIAAGPLETIGRTVDAAQASKLQFVTMISHSDWNNVHADTEHGSKYNIAYLTNKGIKYKKIPDQNGNDNGTFTDLGLKRPVSVYESRLKNHTNDKMKWLWTCRKMPEYEIPSYQVGKYDPSDAGMTWYVITGGVSNNGDDKVTPQKAFNLLEAYLNLPTSVENEIALESANEVYPNPSTDGKFYLGKVSNWEVFSNQGTKMLSGNGSEIDLSSFDKGVYFLKLENGAIKNIVVQ